MTVIAPYQFLTLHICSFYFQHISILIGCLFDLLLSIYVGPRCQKEREKNENQRTKDSTKVSLIIFLPWQVTLEAKYPWFSLVTFMQLILVKIFCEKNRKTWCLERILFLSSCWQSSIALALLIISLPAGVEPAHLHVTRLQFQAPKAH